MCLHWSNIKTNTASRRSADWSFKNCCLPPGNSSFYTEAMITWFSCSLSVICVDEVRITQAAVEPGCWQASGGKPQLPARRFHLKMSNALQSLEDLWGKTGALSVSAKQAGTELVFKFCNDSWAKMTTLVVRDALWYSKECSSLKTTDPKPKWEGQTRYHFDTATKGAS